MSISNSRAQTNDQQTKVLLRAIGHEFLLQLSDSTSRILPIENSDGRYAMQFEREFALMPDVLHYSIFKVLEESGINDSYIVEIEKCGSKEVVYSFKAALKKEDNMAPCQGRELPKDCYIFYFTPIGKFEPIQNIVTRGGTEDSNWYFVFLILFTIAGAGVIFYLIKRRKSSKMNLDVIDIGQFQFDKKGLTLKLKMQSIELSSKEADLLFLLYTNENKTLKRDYILKVVWGDDGDYVGRTLDVFISKLRKKLDADSSLKIINIRGVGYRFVIN